ncbi:hypothetical protein QUF61_08805 [Candidatus Venteria ishoeyi]|uniref:hypothetical protein n=1 Tax=Candidatus Venteria ishoeyi TaxID=1899563 RepID=UPI0025A668F1|nr:hypothetical protein [Candidatus Venteria ishoeyi]MDM8546578.1 hypothetical protein [Candidatus Venteria ishoeyi]
MNKKQISILLLIISLTTPLSAAWWINDINGKDCLIIRDAEPIQPLLLMALKSGDEVQVKADSSLQLTTDQNQQQKVFIQNSPFRIPETPPPPSLIDNLFTMVNKWFSQKTNQQVASIDLSARGIVGTGFQIQGVNKKGKNYLLHGQKTLFVYWQAGVAPYQLTLQQREKEIATLKTKQKDKQKEARLSFAALSVGEYQLVLEDNYYQKKMILIRVVDKLPANVEEIQQAGLPENIQQAYIALALSKDPAWRLQAQQMLQNRPALLVQVLTRLEIHL